MVLHLPSPATRKLPTARLVDASRIFMGRQVDAEIGRCSTPIQKPT
jgi:hypothetical protein